MGKGMENRTDPKGWGARAGFGDKDSVSRTDVVTTDDIFYAIFKVSFSFPSLP